MESLTFFGLTMEYSGNEMSTFPQIVLISFRSYTGILNPSRGVILPMVWFRHFFGESDCLPCDMGW
jgi:hypothetical protein